MNYWKALIRMEYIARFIEKKGEGIHHIAFEVADIEAEMERLKKEGFVLLNEKPKAGADNKLVCFLHPKHTNGVLIELCMRKDSFGANENKPIQANFTNAVFFYLRIGINNPQFFNGYLGSYL